MITCIVLAAGAGRRMQLETNKIFLPLGDLTVLQWDLWHLKDVKDLGQVIIVTAKDEMDLVKSQVCEFQRYLQIKKNVDLPFHVDFVIGGAERQDSVGAGLKALNSESSIILVHDGARPMAQAAIFDQVAEAAIKYGAAVSAVPSIDTVKRVGPDKVVLETLNRSELYNMQTPQGFQRDLFLESYHKATSDGYRGTDDVSLVEYSGKPVHVVIGDYKNIKLTTPNDISVMKRYLGVKENALSIPMMRVGYGYDVHRFKEGRPCILGGVQIDSPIGPDGHSDADVLIHALMDALLGAAGLRDIGYYFPPEDPAFKGASSMNLLEQVISLLKDEGLQAYNIDVMVIAEAPKIKPYIEEMKANLSALMGLPLKRISIKATTNEKLGALGRQEGIAAQAVVSVYDI